MNVCKPVQLGCLLTRVSRWGAEEGRGKDTSIYIEPRRKRTPLTRPYPGYARQCRNTLGLGYKKRYYISAVY